MKFATIMITVLVAAIAGVTASPFPVRKSYSSGGYRPSRNTFKPGQHRYCHMPGQSCGRVKRAVDAAAAAILKHEDNGLLAAVDPEFSEISKRCEAEGGRCYKAKRALEALSKAIVEADEAIDSEAEDFEDEGTTDETGEEN